MRYYVYKLQNPEDFKGCYSATIEPAEPYGRSKLYKGRFEPSHFQETIYSKSIEHVKKLIREEWKDAMHRGKRMKWKKYMWHKDGEVEL